MSNFLDMRSPGCGNGDRLDIQANVCIRVTNDGTDASAPGCGEHGYLPTGAALCNACDHVGTVRKFVQAGGDR